MCVVACICVWCVCVGGGGGMMGVQWWGGVRSQLCDVRANVSGVQTREIVRGYVLTLRHCELQRFLFLRVHVKQVVHEDSVFR